MDVHSLRNLLDRALRALRPRYRNMPFDLETIRQEMENINGAALMPDDAAKIGPLMQSLWGTGVEPAALGGEVWRFGFSRPPVSREIG